MRRLGRVGQAVEVAGTMELDEGLAAATGAHLPVGDERVAGQGSTVPGLPGELPFLGDGRGPYDDPGRPLGALLIVLPEIHGRPGERFSCERHVNEGESLVPSRHRVHGNRVSVEASSPARAGAGDAREGLQRIDEAPSTVDGASCVTDA